MLRVARWGGNVSTVAHLEAYQLDTNPDGQAQFGDDGTPLDALSNPVYVLERPGGVLVADGGANAVLSINADGKVRTLFASPLVATGACADRENNDAEHTGCDPVPTGLAWAPDGSLWVSTLSGEAEGEGIAYHLNPYSGEVLDTIGGLNSPLGIAVGDDGSVYVSEGLHGMPEGVPEDDFDPASIGRVVRIATDGTRSYAAVPMVTGLLFDGGELYASAWSLGSFVGLEDAGQIVMLSPEAFVTPEAPPADDNPSDGTTGGPL